MSDGSDGKYYHDPVMVHSGVNMRSLYISISSIPSTGIESLSVLISICSAPMYSSVNHSTHPLIEHTHVSIIHGWLFSVMFEYPNLNAIILYYITMTRSLTMSTPASPGPTNHLVEGGGTRKGVKTLKSSICVDSFFGWPEPTPLRPTPIYWKWLLANVRPFPTLLVQLHLTNFFMFCII